MGRPHKLELLRLLLINLFGRPSTIQSNIYCNRPNSHLIGVCLSAYYEFKSIHRPYGQFVVFTATREPNRRPMDLSWKGTWHGTRTLKQS